MLVKSIPKVFSLSVATSAYLDIYQRENQVNGQQKYPIIPHDS